MKRTKAGVMKRNPFSQCIDLVNATPTVSGEDAPGVLDSFAEARDVPEGSASPRPSYEALQTARRLVFDFTRWGLDLFILLHLTDGSLVVGVPLSPSASVNDCCGVGVPYLIHLIDSFGLVIPIHFPCIYSKQGVQA